MKRSQISLLIIGFILLALMATNPSIEDHRQAVMEDMKKKMSEESNTSNKWEMVGEAIGIALGQGIVEKAVSRDNYLIFSITKISLNDKKTNIGYGVLGKVFVQDYKKVRSGIFGDNPEEMTNQSLPTEVNLTPRINPSNNNTYMWYDLASGTYRSKNCNSKTTYEWNRNEPGYGMAQMSLTEANSSMTVAEFSTAMDNYQIIEGGLILGDSKKLIIISSNSFVTSDGCIWVRD